MTRQELLDRLKKGPLILDGATGSNLMKAGMPKGICTEKWVADHPDILINCSRTMWKQVLTSSTLPPLWQTASVSGNTDWQTKRSL